MYVTADMKDTLEPGKRLATQRRLTALEADLAAAERRAVESKNGERYHRIKFFGGSSFILAQLPGG